MLAASSYSGPVQVIQCDTEFNIKKRIMASTNICTITEFVPSMCLGKYFVNVVTKDLCNDDDVQIHSCKLCAEGNMLDCKLYMYR